MERVKPAKHLAVDDIAAGKVDPYLTIVPNFQTGEVLWARHGRANHAVRPFCRFVREDGVEPVAIAVDRLAPSTETTCE